MKQNYITGMNKITASDDLREKTLAAMNAQSGKPKQTAFKRRYIALAAAACFIVVAAVPSAINMLGTKSAAPMQAPFTMGAKQAAPDTAGGADVNENGVQSTMAASPENAKIRNVDLTIDLAREIAINGEAFLENAENPGGYEASGLEIIKAEAITAENGTVYYKITAVTKDGNEIILIVK